MSTVCVGKSFGWASLVCLTTEAVRLSKRKFVFKVLKDFPNKDLEKQVKEAETENQKKQLEDKLNSVKKTVSDTQKQLDGKNKQISDLHKQLGDLNKDDKSPDKEKHVSDKQKEIAAANEDKNQIKVQKVSVCFAPTAHRRFSSLSLTSFSLSQLKVFVLLSPSP